MRIELLGVALMLTGCVTPFPIAEMKIDETMPPEAIADIESAAVEWQDAGATLTFERAPASKANVYFIDTECPGDATACASTMGRIAFERSSRLDIPLRTKALHEIGHFLGCHDHIPPPAIMQAHSTKDLPWHLTEADLEHCASVLR